MVVLGYLGTYKLVRLGDNRQVLETLPIVIHYTIQSMCEELNIHLYICQGRVPSTRGTCWVSQWRVL